MRMTGRLGHALWPAGLLCLLLMSPGCTGENEQAAAVYHPLQQVRVACCELRTVRPALETFGTLVYRSKADIYPGIDGTIEQVAVEEGQEVSAGQVLARFSTELLLTSREQIEAEVDSKRAMVALAQEKLRGGRRAVEARVLEIQKAEAELAQRKAEFENISQVYANKIRLYEAGGISAGELEALRTRFVTARLELTRAERDLDIRRIGFRDRDITAAGLKVPTAAQQRLEVLAEINTGMLAAELRVAEAELGAAQAELRRIVMMLQDTVVRAPIAGIVGMRFIEAGEKADRSSLLFTLFRTDTMYAQAEVTEEDLSRLRVAQEAELLFEGEAQRRATGRVELISPYINPQSRTARVRVRLDNPDGTLVPGMFTRIRVFTAEAAQRPVIPSLAVLDGPEASAPDGAAVFVVRNGRLFRREVRAGRREGDFTVILQGLEPGETVVLDASAGLQEGTEVEVLQ
jgi:RND family efflux transporter MFP subunit